MADRTPKNADQSSKETRIELKDLAHDAQDIIVHANSVFPFQLFPDSISIDRVKVNITRRTFFKVSEVISTRIEDILNVESDTGPFFGSINLYTRFFADKPLRVYYLTRKDTLIIKGVLQGYIIARQQDIDCSTIDRKELKKLLLRLGNAPAPEPE